MKNHADVPTTLLLDSEIKKAQDCVDTPWILFFSLQVMWY